MKINYQELFQSDKLTPKHLLPLLQNINGRYVLSDLGSGLRHLFLSLWENPLFLLLTLEEPKLIELSCIVEKQWLSVKIHEKRNEIEAFIGESARERGMRLLEETYALAGITFHSFTQIIYSGKNRWPYFTDYCENRLLSCCKDVKYELESTFINTIDLLQYNNKMNNFIFWGALWARSLASSIQYQKNPIYYGIDRFLQSYTQMRVDYKAKCHIIDCLQNNKIFDYDLIVEPYYTK